MSILIIGSKGFLGKNLVDYFTANGFEVDTLSRSDGDLRSWSTWQHLQHGVKFECIILCAEKTGNQIFHNKNNAFETIQDNNAIVLNLNKLLRSIRKTVKLFTFGSLWTAPVKVREIREENLFAYSPSTDIPALLATKIILYNFVRSINIEKLHHASIITPGTLYGPYDNSDHLIPSMIRKLKKSNGSLNLHGNGASVRNYTYVGDFAACLHEIIVSDHRCPENLIVASDVNHQISEVVKIISEEFGVSKLSWGEREDTFQARMPNVKLFNDNFNVKLNRYSRISDFNKSDFWEW